MIPYFTQPVLSLGNIHIHAFALLVLVGIMLAIWLIKQRAQKLDLNTVLLETMIVWVLISAFVCAHIFDRLAYYPQQTLQKPLSLLYLNQGISSFGGFMGAAFAAYIMVKHYQLKAQGWQYAEVLMYAFPVGWFFGRLGCFVAYDHVGIQTTFFLGQYYTDGVVHHNLGLEEALYSAIIAIVFLYIGRNGRIKSNGFFIGLFCVLYAPFRFFMDFLRIEDQRYAALTAAQYGMVLLFILGIWLLAKRHKVLTNLH